MEKLTNQLNNFLFFLLSYFSVHNFKKFLLMKVILYKCHFFLQMLC